MVSTQPALNAKLYFAHILAADGGDHIIWWCTEQLRDNRELIHMVLSGEQWLALQHLGKDAACTPYVHLYIILLPREHDLRCSVVSRRNVARHLRVLYTRQPKIADFEVAILVYEDVRRFEVTVHNSSGMDIFEAALSRLDVAAACACHCTHQDLVQEVLNELFLQRP